MFLIDPIHAKYAAVVGILLLGNALILESIMQSDLPVCPSRQDVVALGAVLQLVDETLVRLV
jgi:hypothetical protein